jgi:hypothetical protein
MKLYAKVKKVTGGTKHYIGTIINDQPVPVEDMPIATWVVIKDDDESGGFFLFRYDKDGNFGGDTWHLTLDEAKGQGKFEYEIDETDWSPNPPTEINLPDDS